MFGLLGPGLNEIQRCRPKKASLCPLFEAVALGCVRAALFHDGVFGPVDHVFGNGD